jgi:hypothetical protein
MSDQQQTHYFPVNDVTVVTERVRYDGFIAFIPDEHDDVATFGQGMTRMEAIADLREQIPDFKEHQR